MGIRHSNRIHRKKVRTRQGHALNFANAISISRILLAIPLVLLLENKKLWEAFIVILLIVLSDFLDGYVARKANTITNFGKLIDPIADKVCMLVVAIYLIIVYKLPFLIFFMTLAVRDTFLIIIGVYLILSQEEVFQSNISGKWFMGISTLMMTFFIFQNPLNIPEYLLWLSYVVSVILFIISTYEYIIRYLRYFKQLDAK